MRAAELDVREATPQDAEAVVGVIRRAFASRPVLDPPSTALDETVETVAEVLSSAGGLLVVRRDQPIGALLFDTSRPGLLGLRRVSVDPAGRDRGVASAMVGVAENIAEDRGLDGMWLHAREELPENVSFWRHRQYVEVSRSGTTIEMGKTLWLAREVPDLDALEQFAGRLASLVRAGDLLIATGDLGAGKTAFTRAFGQALGVAGPITSPTFIVARRHRALGDGPDLVHVDAYRLGDAAEVDDLDLDETLDSSVTVVEWGQNMAEHLSDSWLHLTFERRNGVPADPYGTSCGVESDEMRVVTVRPCGPRWIGVPLRSTVLAETDTDAS